MKKAFVLVIIFLSYLFPLLSQESIEKPIYKKEVGFDATNLLTNLLSSKWSYSNTDIIYFYKLNNGEHKLRLGLGGGFSIKTKNSRNNIDLVFSIGKEKEIKLSDRWHIFRGVDFRSLLSINFGKDRDTQTSINLGVAPFIGLKLKLIPRLWLSTEFSYGFFLGLERFSKEFEYRLFSNYYVPKALFLSYNF